MIDRLALLRRTQALTAGTVLVVAHWLFGNLYEQVVTVPPALTEPRPGALVGPLDLGSPLFYYTPLSIPLALTLVWVLAVRVRRSVPSGDDRRAAVLGTRMAAVAVTAAAALKVLLITTVNPGFRDATVTPEVLREQTILWLVGNGSVVLLLAGALVGVLAWRRLPAEPATLATTQPAMSA